ncbi:MAG: ABC-F family ATP-binding cassette domain-containing protein, partial [Clostridia bacterium]|nr:ABC-F family ATP-binding cassette domain-containing protein [Clostridia bacterium]
STSNMAKSRMKTLESMEIIEKPEGDLKKMKLRFDITHEPYKDVLMVEDLDVEVGEEKKLLARGINLDIKRKEKIAVIGENGIGKSSLLKTILGIIPHTKGEIEWGKNTTISYYEQENLNLDPEKIALDELWDRFPDITETEIRKVLGSVLLSQDDVYKPVKVISGGERTKLAFAEIMLEKANVMLLDEPTNHLDLVSKEVLEKALMDYEGTLIFVSHDRYLLNKVPDKIIEITKNGAVIYNGGYDYYMEHLPKEEEIKKPKEEKEKTEKPKTDYRSKEQRKLDVQRKNRLKELEKIIEETETEIAETEQAMTEETVFSDYVKMNELCEKLENMKNKLEEYYEEWTLLGE